MEAIAQPVEPAAGHRRRWRWRGPAWPEPPEALARHLGTGPLLTRLLAERGHGTPEAADRFLAPRLTHLHDPSDLPGAPEAAERIAAAVQHGQPIVLYGDYDVDGLCGAALLWHLLRGAGAEVSCYIPHRIEEGYGLGIAALEQLAARRPRPLVVSIDCGITAREAARAAREAGLELIITDHHAFDAGALPEALLVHPGLPGSRYPWPHLCGAGVAYKLGWQFARSLTGCERVPEPFRSLLVDTLALVALATVADVVPLEGENRALTAHGLRRVKTRRFEGLAALVDEAKLRDEQIEAFHAGFVIGPRLNACGRMGHAGEALTLLTTATGAEAARLAARVSGQNERRRAIEREVTAAAAESARAAGGSDPARRAIVVAGEGWHPGVVGIVASRLVEQFARPAVVLSLDGDRATGSARSVEGVSIHDALTACAGHLQKWGGHAMAAGLTLEAGRIGPFRESLIAWVNEQLGAASLVPAIDVDLECPLGRVGLPALAELERLAPFGNSNPRPNLLARGLKVLEPPRRVGRGGEHLQLRLGDGPVRVKGIGFGLGELIDQAPAGARLDVLFTPKPSSWRGRVQTELHVKDFRTAQPAHPTPPPSPPPT